MKKYCIVGDPKRSEEPGFNALKINSLQLKGIIRQLNIGDSLLLDLSLADNQFVDDNGELNQQALNDLQHIIYEVNKDRYGKVSIHLGGWRDYAALKYMGFVDFFEHIVFTKRGSRRLLGTIRSNTIAGY